MEMLYPSVVLVQDRDVARKLEEYAGESMRNCVVKLFSPFEDQETPGGWEELGEFMERGKNVSDDVIENMNIVRKDDDVVVVLMTSGTTSLPKGCPHTNRSYVSQLLGTNEMLGLNEGARRKALNHAVPSHLMGANFSMMFHAAGLPVVHPAAVFSAQSSVRAIELERCSNMTAVPAIVHAMVAEESWKSVDTSCVKMVTMGMFYLLLCLCLDKLPGNPYTQFVC